MDTISTSKAVKPKSATKKPKKESSPEEKEQNKSVSSFIAYVFNLRSKKPDVSQWKMWTAQLQPFMVNSANGHRVYSLEQMKKVADYLNKNGIHQINPSMFYYGDLVSNVIDEHWGSAAGGIQEIKRKYSNDVQQVPQGW